MELFYGVLSADGRSVTLEEGESAHCIKVMRHCRGDMINVIDGRGTMYDCVVEEADARGVVASVKESHPSWGSHPYKLTLAVCPTKNSDRYEWFVEKAAEIGVDRIVPIIGERSERRVFKTQRLERILLSAAKQSLKAAVPEVAQPVDAKEFIASCDSPVKLIAYCFGNEGERLPITGAITGDDITIMIGPEGDFSPAEAQLAISCGFVPIHLGPSRLRTETAAVTAAEAVYLKYI